MTPDRDRPWHKTACIICALNCGVEVQTDGRRITKIRGDDDHPVSKGYVCEKSQRLPVVGHNVVVQCKGFRCLAYRTKEGKWIDALHEKELPEVISWYDPAL